MTKAPRVRKGRPTDKQTFLNALTRLSEQGVRMVSNATMKDDLEWDDTKYRRIRDQLTQAESIVVGRGRGGSIGLAAAPNAAALRIFTSYAHEDEAAKDELHKHLSPLRRMGLVDLWHDRQITAGRNWNEEIAVQLDQADIVIFLISVDFINSDYCYGVEVERAMERHDNGDARVIPVIYRNCMWQQAPFAKLQALPKDAVPIASSLSRDDGFVNVANGIRLAIEDILKNR